MLAIDVVGKQIRNVDGLARNGQLHPVQQAFCDKDALMCGFCTPAFVMASVGLSLCRTPRGTFWSLVWQRLRLRLRGLRYTLRKAEEVPADLLARHGAVSEPVARAMAEGVRAKFGTDLAVATTGFAGPTGGTEADPVGTAYVALAHAGGTEVTRHGWLGTRSEVMSRTAKLALNVVRLRLRKDGHG